MNTPGNVQQGIALFQLQIQSLIFSALFAAFLSMRARTKRMSMEHWPEYNLVNGYIE